MTTSATRAPTATYRVQLNKEFTFADARRIVPYLERLGVSHLYCSPVLAARPGSMHGYDVVDPTHVNPELGTDEEWRALAAELHERGMGIVLDIVPNHMGVGPANQYWEDLLAHGERSRWAHWFDVDWEPRTTAGPSAPHTGRVVLPVLGGELDAVVGRGEIRLDVSEGRARLRYFDNTWPIDPATLPDELQLAQWDPAALDAANALLAANGYERLKALLDAQHYRLVHWRRAPDEINYRRFFDVNDLAALHTENPRVFAETHALVLQWVKEGVVDGLRVDHIDGLLDPLCYLQRLREAVGPDVPIVVEKILSPGESLRREWPVQGTTGYEFLNDLEELFVVPAGFAEIEHCYRQMRKLAPERTFEAIAHDGKVAILDGALRADVDRLAAHLRPLLDGERARWSDDDLVAGLVAFIAALPVYRTYVDVRAAPDDADRQVVETAVTRVRERRSDRAAEVAAFVGDVVLARAGRADAKAWLRFVQRLQQTSGPATAKGVEDTALYVYVPLASRNEVGGAPDRPLDDVPARLHRANAERSRHWPRALLTTNTHDTKRSADVRARLDALTLVPAEWERCVARWRKLNHRHKATVRGRLAPDTNSEYLVYQTLYAMWPAPRPGRRSDDLPDRAWREGARDRVKRYMRKASREAKLRTSWIDPDAEYEKALDAFVAAILEPAEDAPFLPDVARLVAQLAPAAHRIALARVLVHLTAPGIPDVYQGDELWNLTLVDPDNRRPVDYERRRGALDEIGATDLPTLARDLADPRVKLAVTHRLLEARRRAPELWREGSYQPLEARGPAAGELFAYIRSAGGRQAIAVATHPVAPGGPGGDLRTAGERWGTTHLILPAESHGRRWRSVLDGQEWESTEGGAMVPLAALSALPIALLVSE